MLFEGRCNTEVLNPWLAQMLSPELTAGSVMVLDKATFHTSKRTQELVDFGASVIGSARCAGS